MCGAMAELADHRVQRLPRAAVPVDWRHVHAQVAAEQREGQRVGNVQKEAHLRQVGPDVGAPDERRVAVVVLKRLAERSEKGDEVEALPVEAVMHPAAVQVKEQVRRDDGRQRDGEAELTASARNNVQAARNLQ